MKFGLYSSIADPPAGDNLARSVEEVMDEAGLAEDQDVGLVYDITDLEEVERWLEDEEEQAGRITKRVIDFLREEWYRAGHRRRRP